MTAPVRSRRLHVDARRRRNGDTTPPQHELDYEPREPREPRWILLGLAICLASATLVTLGIWKLYELLSRAV